MPPVSSQASSSLGMNPLVTQPYQERGGREDFIEEGEAESPNIRLEDDYELARYNELDDDEMDDIGNENVNLRGIPNDRNRHQRGLHQAGIGHEDEMISRDHHI